MLRQLSVVLVLCDEFLSNLIFFVQERPDDETIAALISEVTVNPVREDNQFVSKAD